MVRSTNLALELKSHEIHFLIEDYGGIKKLLVERGYDKVSFLPNDVSPSSDLKKTLEYIKNNEIDLLIVDKYRVDSRYLKEIKKFVRVVVITDLKKFDHPSDLVVNGFIGFKNQIKVNSYGARCLLGPSYQILNRNFQTKKKSQGKKYAILATFGGFDESNIIRDFLNTIEKYLDKYRVKLILGPGTTKSNKIKDFQRRYKNNLQVLQHTKDMHGEILQSKFGICSGGITSYEFAAMGVPFAIICQAPHQLLTAREWERRGLAYNLGMNKKIPKKLDSVLKRFLHGGRLKTKKRLVDGKGSFRVSKQIEKLLMRKNTLRK